MKTLIALILLLTFAYAGYSPCFTINQEVFRPSQRIELNVGGSAWTMGKGTHLLFAFGDLITNVESSIPDDCPVVDGKYIYCQFNRTMKNFVFTATVDPNLTVLGNMLRNETHITVSGVIGDEYESSMYNYDQTIWVVYEPASMVEILPSNDRPGYFADAILAPPDGWTWMSMKIKNHGPDDAEKIVITSVCDPSQLLFESASGTGAFICTVASNNASVDCTGAIQVGSVVSVAIMTSVAPNVDTNTTSIVYVTTNAKPSWYSTSSQPMLRILDVAPPYAKSVQLFPDIREDFVVASGEAHMFYGPRLPECYNAINDPDYGTSVNGQCVVEVDSGLSVDLGKWTTLGKYAASYAIGTIVGEQSCEVEIPVNFSINGNGWGHVTSSALSDNQEFDDDGYPAKYVTTFALSDDPDVSVLRFGTPYQPWNLGNKPVFNYTFAICNLGPGASKNVFATVDMIELSSGLKLDLLPDFPSNCHVSHLAMDCEYDSIEVGHCIKMLARYRVNGRDGDAFAVSTQKATASNGALLAMGPEIYPMIFKQN